MLRVGEVLVDGSELLAVRGATPVHGHLVGRDDLHYARKSVRYVSDESDSAIVVSVVAPPKPRLHTGAEEY
jgi:hypothetical protein